MKARATLILITLFCAMMASMQSARAATITVTNTNDSGAGSLRQALASGSLTCTLPPATIAVTRTAGGTTGTINESVYSMSADTGSNFRIDGCQYIYNLKSSALGVGTYRVDILINSLVVGSAAFQLKWPSLVSICNVYLPGKRSACPTIVNSFAANCRAGAPPAPFSHRVNRDQGSRRKSEV